MEFPLRPGQRRVHLLDARQFKGRCAIAALPVWVRRGASIAITDLEKVRLTLIDGVNEVVNRTRKWASQKNKPVEFETSNLTLPRHPYPPHSRNLRLFDTDAGPPQAETVIKNANTPHPWGMFRQHPSVVPYVY